VASGGHGGVTRLWDMNSGHEMLALAGHTGWVLGITIRPDGNLLVSTSNELPHFVHSGLVPDGVVDRRLR
jgi:WD40 repeat protein